MSAKHTPGPWVDAGRYGNLKHEVQGSHGFRRAVAAVWTHDAVGKDEYAESPEGMANLRLITAAPELLAVLVEMFANGPVQVAFVGNPTACAGLHARACAAIAKATGGAA